MDVTPQGFRTLITATLSVRNGPRAIAFYKDCWRLGRILDPFGHHWEIGRQVGTGVTVSR